MIDGDPRSRRARRAAERALVRIVHHYGERPEFAVLGGLVPELLCAEDGPTHAGTTDVDVQVDLEIESGSINARRLEKALYNAEFRPQEREVWRWTADRDDQGTVVTFELLSDLDTAPAESTVQFDEASDLGAMNLRGSGFASRDTEVRELTAKVGEERRTVEVKFAGLAGFLLAKNAAANSRRNPKDWYDMAFVLLHNEYGGPAVAARKIADKFGDEIRGSVETALRELRANFADHDAQGTQAYVSQMIADHPDRDRSRLGADAITAVDEFCENLLD